MNGSLLLSGQSQWVRYRNVALGSVWVNVASGGRLFSQRSVAVGRRKSRGAFGEGKVAMGKEIVAWELSRWEVLPVENLQRRLDQSFAGSHLNPSTHNTGNRDCPTGDVVTPESENQCKGGDLEGDQQSFIDEEIPASHEAECIIDEMTS